MQANAADKKQILLVDDHTLFREGLKVLLRENPRFSVAGEAGTVFEACERVELMKPDLVLMDIALPDKSGIEGVRFIKEKQPSTKVVMISMYSNIDFVIKSIRAGAVGFIVKDSTPDILLKALATVSEGHYYFDHKVLDEIVQFMLAQVDEETRVSDERYDRLTPREQEIMRLVAQGLSSKQIANKLNISPKTVENHRGKLMEKLELDSVIDLVKYAAALGIIEIRGSQE
ncbi:MAG: response regulator transcription factor [Deltaproteobacteria bacterium]|nr:response regulator transcription factor [Deltaproteobacteria bacterium]